MRRFFKNCKRAMAISLAGFVTFSGPGFNVPVVMAEASEIASGNCGIDGNETSVTWSLSSDGVLTISGNGPMMDYAGTYSNYTSCAPWAKTEYKNQITSVIVNPGVTSIGANAFCKGETYSTLTSVQLADSVVSVGESAFRGCAGVSSIDLTKVNTIGKDAFMYCTSLASVDISSATSLGQKAFYSCSNLATVTLGNGLNALDDETFYLCGNLSTINLEKITTIGKSVFSQCDSLASVDLTSATSVGANAFEKCNNLASIKINKSTSFDPSAFLDSSSEKNCPITTVEVSDCGATDTEISDLQTYFEGQSTQTVTVSKKAHDFKYSVTNEEPSKLKYSCVNEGGCGASTFATVQAKDVVASATDRIYDNSTAYEAEVIYDTEWSNLNPGKELSVVYKRGAEATTDLKSAGTITAVISSAPAAGEEGENPVTPVEASCSYVVKPAALETSVGDVVVTDGTVETKNYDGTTGATVTGLTFTGLLGADTLSIGTDYTVSNAVFTSTLIGTDTINAKVTLSNTGNYCFNYDAESNPVYEKDFTDIKITPAIATGVLAVETAPQLSGTYGTAVEDMTLTDGTVTAGTGESATVITGTWSITDTNKADIPSVGTTTEYELTFTPDSSYKDGNNVALYSAVTTKVVPTVSAKALTSSDVTISEVTGTFTYDGNEQKPTVSVSGTPAISVSDSGAIITDNDFEISCSNNINAYTLTSADSGFDSTKAPTITITGKGNYEGTVTRYFTINKATATDIETTKNVEYSYDLGGSGTWNIAELIPTGAGTVTYELGTETDLNDILTASVSADGTLTYTVATGNIDNTASVTVKASSDNYEDITFTFSTKLVDKANVTVDMTNVNLQNKTYDGQAVSYTGAATGVYGADDAAYTGTFEYKWYNEDETTELESAPVAVGTYVLKAIVATAGYQGQGSKSVTISPATPEYTVPTGLTATYGDTLGSIALGAGFSWEDPETTLVGNVGDNSFNITFTPSDTSNYTTVTNIPVTIAVSAKSLTADSVAISEVSATLTYDGTEKKPIVTVGDTAATITTSDYEITYLNNVNAYTFASNAEGFVAANAPTVVITGKGNYSGTIYRYFTIDKKTATGITTEKELEYSYDLGGSGTWNIAELLPSDAGTAEYALGTKTDINNILTASVSNAGVFTYAVATGEINNTANVTVKVSSTNYADITFTFKAKLIDKDVVTVDMTNVNLQNKTYDGQAITYTGAAAGRIEAKNVAYAGTFAYKWFDENGTNELASAPTNAGTYVLKAIVTTAGYKGEGSKSVTINKAIPTYTLPTGLTATYGDNLGTIALGEGFVWESPLTTLVGNVGNKSFNVKFTPSDIDNYNVVTNIPVNVTVNPKSLSASSVSISQVAGTFTYDGTEKKPTVTVGDSAATLTASDYEITYLNNKNAYTFASNAEGFNAANAPTVVITGKGNYAGTIYRYFVIDKKASTNPSTVNKSYIYSAGSKNETVDIDIAALLPADRGASVYSLQECSAGYIENENIGADGKLHYKVGTSGSLNDTTDLVVKISSTNYTDITATVHIRLIDKNVIVQKSSAPVKIEGTTILTYGDRIDKLRLNSTKAVFVIEGTDTAVSGTLSWTTPELVPTVGTVKASWTFTPDLPNEHKVCTGTVDMSVVKASPIVSIPTVAERTYNPGIKLNVISMTGQNGSWKLGGVDTTVPGTWSWKDSTKVPVVNNQGYVAVFTPNDTVNYNKIEKTVSIKVNKATPYITVLPRAVAITYGDDLSKSGISGGTVIYSNDSSVVAYNQEVKGTFSWKNGAIKPAVLDSYKTKYRLVFTPNDSDNYNTCETEITLKINKKKAKELTGDSREFVYSIGSESDQTVNIAKMLPSDCGKTAYSVSKSGVVSFASITNGNLVYRVRSGAKDSEGSVTVTVVSDNYENHSYTVKVKLVDKENVDIKEGCKVAVIDENKSLVYGDMLSSLALSQPDGTKLVFTSSDGDVVAGKVEWVNPSYAPSVSEQEAEWVFIPTESGKYMECRGTAAIKVVKGTPTVSEISVIDITYNSSVALKDLVVSGKGFYTVGNDVVDVAGVIMWENANAIPTVDKQEYAAVFVPDNQIDYNVASCKVKVRVKKATPKIVELPVTSEITYKDTLGMSKLSGGQVKYSDDDTVVGYNVVVPGTFAWSNDLFTPSVSDSEVTKFEVKFTPNDTVNYETVKTGVTVKVNKILNPPNMPYDTINVKFGVDKRVGDVSLDAFDGWEWDDECRQIKLTSDAAGTVAIARYSDWDKGNFANVTKEVTIYMEECNHRGGIATCTKLAVCNICKCNYGELNPDNHENVELKNVAAATCLEGGYTGDLYCNDCGKVLTAGESIPAKGHDYIISLEIPSTITDEGLRIYTCTICGDSYSENIPKIPTEDGVNDILVKGLYVAEKTETTVLVGMVVDTPDLSQVEYSWWVSRDGGERWSLIQNWTKGDEWLLWNPKGYGDYMIMGKARIAGKTAVVEASFETTFHPAIKGICQMPYSGEGGGYLIGIESVDDPNHKYQYEMLILDCTLLAEGKDAWVYTTGKCGAEGNCLWTVWQPDYGYYWTLFRIYDDVGNLVDEMCYGFANVY